MRFLSTLITLVGIGYALFWTNTNHPDLKYKLMDYIRSGEFHTLEMRYDAKYIMETQKHFLLKDDHHKFLKPVLKFHPYLLLEVKYSSGKYSTQEGVILWDLVDGEMVIDARNWEKTHGFADCINNNSERYEFKIINHLANRGGAVDREGLIRALHVEDDILDKWIDSCRRKKLIVQTGNDYRLHLEHPKLDVTPSTHISDPLVTKSFKHTNRIARRYTPTQIKRVAYAAFGNDFAIRNTMDVYLPIHSITVQNPDGSKRSSHWNALNGQHLSSTSLIE